MPISTMEASPSFTCFERLPQELQILIWKDAFANSEFLDIWRGRLLTRQIAKEMGLDVTSPRLPAFWYYSHSKDGRGMVVGRYKRRGGTLPVSLGISRLLHTCQLSRLSALEVFRDVMKSIDVNCRQEIEIVERIINAMKE